MENNGAGGRDDDIKELTETLEALPRPYRQHLLRVARLLAKGDLDSGDTLLSRLLGRRPTGKRYQQYERSIKRVQRVRRDRDRGQ